MWQVACGRGKVVVGRWQVVGGRWRGSVDWTVYLAVSGSNKNPVICGPNYSSSLHSSNSRAEDRTTGAAGADCEPTYNFVIFGKSLKLMVNQGNV